jgi:hypothetical protein
MTYTELVTAIQQTAENSFDYSTNPEIINRFIQQTEQRIYNTVQISNLRKNVTGNLTGGNAYLSCPTDFLSVYSLAIYTSTATPVEYTYLLNKDVDFIREAYDSTTGKPKHYAIFGPQSGPTGNPLYLTFIVGPTPDTGYTAELHYYYYPESIVTAGTTWLGQNFDSALLNGALVEAIRYMKGEADMIQLYSTLYISAITLLKNLADGKQRADTHRDGQIRTQVQ